MLVASRTRTGLGCGDCLQSWSAFCKTNGNNIFRELWTVKMPVPALTQLQAGLTTMSWASSIVQLLFGMRTTSHVLQFYTQDDLVPKVRDFAAWHVLAGTERSI